VGGGQPPAAAGAARRGLAARPPIAPGAREPRPLPPGLREHSGPALRFLAPLLAGCLLALPGPAAAAESSYSFFPLPAFDTDPNEGETYGVLPVWLFKDAEGNIRSIIAPSVTWNEIRGVTGTFRYYLYANALERLEVIGSYSEHIDYEAKIQYKNLNVFGGRFHTDFQLLSEAVSSIRFFGIGPTSVKDNESNMTLKTTGVYAIFGVNMTSTMRLSLGETLQKFQVSRGGVPGLPFTGDLFPDLPGIQGATIHAQRVALIYDSRDSLTTPTRGGYVSTFAEASTELLGSDADYIKAGLEGRYLKPIFDGGVVVVVRGLYEGISGDSKTPFQVLPTLGGFESLRGFAENRFYGDQRLLFNAEIRATIYRARIFGVNAELQLTPFVDVGKVFNSWDQLRDSPFEITPGIGLRGLAPPSVVGHIELGFSREGAAIFVGLDYPF
jgi:Omp85 superfamily domain